MQNIDPRPSLKILDALYQYDDFMSSVSTLVDLGCGSGEDLEWWASATTRDESPQPLDIKCVGVDQLENLLITKKYKNVTYQRTDFEETIHPPVNKFDVLWCHDAFQFCIDPIGTLIKWRDISSQGAMLMISMPISMQMQRKHLNFYLRSGMYYHHSMVSLIYMLAVTGWDCRSGFFSQLPNDPWIRSIVYKSDQSPRDPKKTSWYDLLESSLLPESADRSVHAHGYLRQQDLVVPWVDKSFQVMNQV